MDLTAHNVEIVLSRFVLIYIANLLVAVAFLCFRKTATFEFGKMFVLFMLTGLLPVAVHPLLSFFGLPLTTRSMFLAVPSAMFMLLVGRLLGDWIVFNINADVLKDMIDDALEELSLKYERQGDSFLIQTDGSKGATTTITVFYQRVLRYAVLHPEGDLGILSDIEYNLRRSLVNHAVRPMHFEGSLFLTIGLVCFFAAVSI